MLHKLYTKNGAIVGVWLVLSSVEVRKEFTNGGFLATSSVSWC